MASSITSSSSVKAFQNSTHAPSQNGVVVNLVKEVLAGSEMNLNETCIQNTRAYVVFKSRERRIHELRWILYSSERVCEYKKQGVYPVLTGKTTAAGDYFLTFSNSQPKLMTDLITDATHNFESPKTVFDTFMKENVDSEFGMPIKTIPDSDKYVLFNSRDWALSGLRWNVLYRPHQVRVYEREGVYPVLTGKNEVGDFILTLSESKPQELTDAEEEREEREERAAARRRAKESPASTPAKGEQSPVQITIIPADPKSK